MNHSAAKSSQTLRPEPISHHITLRPHLPESDQAHPLRRLRQRGADALSDSELLALMLAPHVGDHALAYANDLLRVHADLRGLRRAAELPMHASTLGDEQVRALLLAAFALGERLAIEPLRCGEPYSSTRDTRRYLEQRLGAKDTEVFAALFLDTRHRLIEYQELFFGSVDSTRVYFREVLRTAMSLNASALVFCHNHPSGSARPSDADIEITRSLIRLLGLVDVRVLDHIIVSAGESASMSEMGLL